MEEFESRLASLRLRCPSPGLDNRIRSGRPEREAAQQPMSGPGGRTRTSWFNRMPPLLKLAAGLLLAALFVGTGWTAEKLYRKFTRISVVLDEGKRRSWTLPNGNKMGTGWTIGTDVDANNPHAVETAKRQHQEMKELIAQKKYKFVKTFESLSGEKQYVYSFTYSDGTHGGLNFSMPLENVASWDDYQRKCDRQHERIQAAVAVGRFRLVNTDVVCHHICRDVESNETLDVQRIRHDDGKDVAYATVTTAKKPEFVQRTSWQDHLRAIREGKRELLDLKTHKHYSYEVTLDDGSKAMFGYSGGEPLKSLAKTGK
jgi:hypothetical protein